MLTDLAVIVYVRTKAIKTTRLALVAPCLFYKECPWLAPLAGCGEEQGGSPLGQAALLEGLAKGQECDSPVLGFEQNENE